MGRIPIKKIPAKVGKIAPHVFRKRVAQTTKWMSNKAIKKLGLSSSFVRKSLTRKGIAATPVLGGITMAIEGARAIHKMAKATKEMGERKQFHKKWKFGVSKKK